MKKIKLNRTDINQQVFIDIVNSIELNHFNSERDIIRDRIKNSNPTKGKKWSEIKDSFKID